MIMYQERDVCVCVWGGVIDINDALKEIEIELEAHTLIL